MSARRTGTSAVHARVWSRAAGRFGLVVVAAVVLAAAVSTVWTPHPLLATGPGWQGPSLEHVLGTDRIGRDTASWLLAGARTTVLVVVGSLTVAVAVGVPLAAVAGLARPRWAEPVVVLVDVLVAFPVLLVAMLLAAPFGGSLAVVVLAVGFGLGVTTARVVRADVVRVVRSDFVLAARASGVGPLGVVRDHVLPNVAPVLLVQLSQGAGLAVLAEAGLSYLGVGAPAGTPSWGRSLADAQGYLTVAPASVVWPGLAITLTVLAFALLGDALRDATDVRLVGARPRSGGDRAVTAAGALDGAPSGEVVVPAPVARGSRVPEPVACAVVVRPSLPAAPVPPAAARRQVSGVA